MGNAPKRWVALLAAALLTACAACSRAPVSPTSTPTPAPTSTSRFSTHTGPLIRATLPPTWTPTATLVPSLTPTPTLITPTLTASPVPLLADLCASFTVNAPIPYGYSFNSRDTITLMLGTPLSAVRDPATGLVDALTVRFLATNPLSGRNQGVQLSGGQVAIVELPVSKLPGSGLYTWTIAVYGDTIGEHCAQHGLFFVAPPVAGELTPTTAP